MFGIGKYGYCRSCGNRTYLVHTSDGYCNQCFRRVKKGKEPFKVDNVVLTRGQFLPSLISRMFGLRGFNCKSCHHINPTGSKFCEDCGVRF